jgi:hypothetical protein
MKKSDGSQDAGSDGDTRTGFSGSHADGAGYMSLAWQLSPVNSKTTESMVSFQNILTTQHWQQIMAISDLASGLQLIRQALCLSLNDHRRTK